MLLVLNGKQGVKWSVLDAKVRFGVLCYDVHANAVWVGGYVCQAVPDEDGRWDAQIAEDGGSSETSDTVGAERIHQL